MRSILFFLFISSFLPLFSQTEKGSFLLNLNGHLTHYDFFDVNNFSGTLHTRAGYAFFDDFFLGVEYQPTYGIYLKQKSSFNILEYGIFSRYYFLENKNRIYLHTDFQHTHITTNTNRNEWSIGAGIARFLSPNASLEAHFNYNIYNRTNVFSDLTPFPGDPIGYSESDPRGLEIWLRMQYFLPSKTGRVTKDEWKPLAERFLNKGNRSIAVDGSIDHKNVGFLGSFEISKFLNNNMRLRHQFFGAGSYGKDARPFSLLFYLPSIERFIPISSPFYFVPSIGIGPTVTYFDSFSPKDDLGWIGSAEIGFGYFFKNSLLSTGYSFFATDGFNNNEETYTTSHIFLTSAFFISEKLAIKPTALYNIHGDGILLFYFENGRFTDVRKFRLQFGFSYYY